MCSTHLSNTDLSRSFGSTLRLTLSKLSLHVTQCWLYFASLLIGSTEDADIVRAHWEGGRRRKNRGERWRWGGRGRFGGWDKRRHGERWVTGCDRDSSGQRRLCACTFLQPTPQGQREEKAICLMSFSPPRNALRLREQSWLSEGEKKTNSFFYSSSQCQILHSDSMLPQCTQLFKERRSQRRSPVTVQPQNMWFVKK